MRLIYFRFYMNGPNGIILYNLLLFTPSEFFPSALAEFVWQEVSSSLQDSSQYYSRSQ